MKENVGLIVAQTADGVLSIVRVREGADDEIWKSVQIKHLLEVTNTISRDIKLSQANETVKSNANRLDVIFSQIQLSQLAQILNAINLLYPVFIDPELFKVDALVQAPDPPDFIRA